MENRSFDQYAEKYDIWFMKNEHVLESELKLVAYFLKEPGNTLSVGCGSGIFEMLLKKEYDVTVQHGIEPSTAMAEIARKRGMTVEVISIEEAEPGSQQYDTILFNGTPSYISDLQLAFNKAFNSLKPGGRIVVIDVPKESSYAILYNLAKVLETWDHPMLEGVQPPDPYPIEFVKAANWRTTAEKVEMLETAGFSGFEYAQTLTKHPVFSANSTEEPIKGHDCGDYVAISAIKAK